MEEKDRIYLKIDDCYLDAVSRFRITIDQMNSSFMNLVLYFHDDFFEDCKNIAVINQKFIKSLIENNSLAHERQFSMIPNYFELKDNDNKNMKELLSDIKDKIKKIFDDFYSNSNESPINDSLKDQFPENKFEKLKKILDESRDSIESDDMMIYDDFIESKIIPLFKDDDYDPYDNNDDDDDDDNGKRYYGNPYIMVPKKVQKAINKYLSFANSLISVNTILNFDAVKEKYSQKAISQQNKIDEEIKREQQRAEKERQDNLNREKEREKEKERQKLARMDIPELLERKEELESKNDELTKGVQSLESKKDELTESVQSLESKKDELTESVQSLESRKDELEKAIKDLEESKEKLIDEINYYEDMKKKLESNIETIRGQDHLDSGSKNVITALLNELSRIKDNMNVLKKKYQERFK